jgi:hypothetical protein
VVVLALFKVNGLTLFLVSLFRVIASLKSLFSWCNGWFSTELTKGAAQLFGLILMATLGSSTYRMLYLLAEVACQLQQTAHAKTQSTVDRPELSDQTAEGT